LRRSQSIRRRRLTQSIGAGSLSPVPWQEVQGWGWSPSSVDMGGMNLSGGGGKLGGVGGAPLDIG